MKALADVLRVPYAIPTAILPTAHKLSLITLASLVQHRHAARHERNCSTAAHQQRTQS